MDDFFAPRSSVPKGYISKMSNEVGIQNCMEDPGLNYVSNKSAVAVNSRNEEPIDHAPGFDRFVTTNQMHNRTLTLIADSGRSDRQSSYSPDLE